jgi:hypothetical protein
MYLTKLKSVVVEALQTVFGESYPNADFRSTFVSIEYPLARQNYPGIWVNYDDRDSLSIAGIDYREFITDNTGTHEVARWTFSGTVTLTAVALSSLERDDLFDELVRVYAFSRIEEDPSVFRTIIENNDFIGVVVNWDLLRPSGDAASPGTPWGTEDEVVYEKSLAFDVEGEFVSDPATNDLVLLSAIKVEGSALDSEGDVVASQSLTVDAGTPVPAPFDPTTWH